MVKIRCPNGEEKEVEACRNCPNPCLPHPIRHSLLKDRDKVRSKKEKPTFGITSLTSNCIRQSYYKLTIEEVHNLEKLWAFSRGQAIHTFITQTLKDEEKEIFVKKDFPTFTILGFIDAIHDGIIYEFKTTHDIPENPQSHHVLQGQAYYSLLNPEQQAKIKKILLIYLSMQKIKTFEVPKRDITGWLYVRAQQLTNALKTEIPPEKEVTWLCNYCDFEKLCDETIEK